MSVHCALCICEVSVLSNVVHLAVLDKSSYTYTSVTDLHAQMVFAYVV